MSRARAARKTEVGEFVAQARARFTGCAPRKARYVADLIRGLTVAEAQQQLAVLHRPSSEPLFSKLLKSAVSNASEKEHAGDTADLVIGEVYVDGGPMLKRFRAAPMGRGVTVRKRMSHMTIRLFTQA